MKPIQRSESIIWLKSITSSNSVLRESASSLDNLSIIAAVEQTAGRGQGSHTWTSTPGENLTFSILYRFEDVAASDAVLVTYITALGIWDYLSSRGVKARIKWPNDIWVGDKKIAGILIENKIESTRLRESVVGIGLNINQLSWHSDIPNPVSLALLTGLSYNLEEELVVLHSCLASRYSQALSSRAILASDFDSLVFHL